MPPHFVINFRREAFQRERERSRRRLFALGGWVTYFGLMALLIGLYGLNCQAVGVRTRRIELRVARAGEARGTWQPGAAEAAFVQARRENPLLWQRRLQRLAVLLPGESALHTVAINPDRLPDAAARNILVISGRLRGVRSSDAMRSVVALVSTLSRDSVFARGFSRVQLASSRMADDGSPAVEFVVECR